MVVFDEGRRQGRGLVPSSSCGGRWSAACPVAMTDCAARFVAYNARQAAERQRLDALIQSGVEDAAQYEPVYRKWKNKSNYGLLHVWQVC